MACRGHLKGWAPSGGWGVAAPWFGHKSLMMAQWLLVPPEIQRTHPLQIFSDPPPGLGAWQQPPQIYTRFFSQGQDRGRQTVFDFSPALSLTLTRYFIVRGICLPRIFIILSLPPNQQNLHRHCISISHKHILITFSWLALLLVPS